MKKSRARLIKLTILLIGLLIIFGLKNQFPNLLSTKPKTIFSFLKKETISQISLITVNKITHLYTKDKHWYVKSDNQELPADEERINKMLDNLILLKKEEVVSRNKNRHGDLGIDKQKIEFKTNNKIIILYIGKSFGLNKNYLRIDDENEVFISSEFADVFYPEDYRDLKVYFVNNESKINFFSIEYNGNKLIAEKKGSGESVGWKIGDKTAKKEQIDFFLNALLTLKAKDILPKDTNLPASVNFLIKIIDSGLQRGNEKTAKFYQQDENNYLLKTSISDYIYQIPAADVASLKKEEKDFIN